MMLGALLALHGWTQEAEFVQPIQPPVPSYPLAALEANLEGACDVYFNVDEEGYTFDIRARCSHQSFCDEAKRAMTEVVFAPLVKDGKPAIRENVVYPIEFTLDPPGHQTAPGGEWCDLVAIS